MKTVSRRILTAALLLATVMLVSCKSGTVPIKTLLDDPSKYDHKDVRVVGTVGHSVGALGYGGYQIDDGTGSLIVVTRGGGAPRDGAKVGVEGEFRSAYTIGTHSGAVLLEKGHKEVS
jgi:hypothetical protein